MTIPNLGDGGCFLAARSWGILLLTLATGACHTPAARTGGGAAEPPSHAEQRGASAALPGYPSPGQGASTAQPGSTLDSTAAPLARSSAPGSTRQTVACGESRCAAGSEVCASVPNGTGWACLKLGAESSETQYSCDDSSDCSAPRVCCHTFASANWYQSCELPNDNCSQLACAAPDGTPCPTGQRCAEGICVADPRASRCGGHQPCPESEPICAWSKSGECVGKAAIEAADEGTAAYFCTRQKDCGSQKCCSAMSHYLSGAFCQNTCAFDLQMVLCESDADCDRMVQEWCKSEAPGCGTHLRCAAPDPGDPTGAPTRPPWLKLCVDPSQE